MLWPKLAEHSIVDESGESKRIRHIFLQTRPNVSTLLA